MSSRFERFAKMAEEEFGLTIVKTESRETSTFESLFGVSIETLAQYELPYSISIYDLGYYDDLKMSIVLGDSLPTVNFDTDEYTHMAA